MPDYAYIYAIPYELYEKYNIRRYGFHGTSHKFVGRKACDLVGLDFDTSKLSPATWATDPPSRPSKTEIGRHIHGLHTAGRPDYGVLVRAIWTLYRHLSPGKEGWTAAETNNFLNKNADCWDCTDQLRLPGHRKRRKEGNPRAILAHKAYAYRVLKYIGAYAAAMDGVDLIVFTGGIGENDAHIRELIGTRLTYLGVAFDKEKTTTCTEKIPSSPPTPTAPKS